MVFKWFDIKKVCWVNNVTQLCHSRGKKLNFEEVNDYVHMSLVVMRISPLASQSDPESSNSLFWFYNLQLSWFGLLLLLSSVSLRADRKSVV